MDRTNDRLIPRDSSTERTSPKKSQVRRREVRKKIKEGWFTLGKGLDIPLLILVLVLLCIGLIVMFSASYASAYYFKNGNSFYYIKNQGTTAIMGVIAMFAISTFNYHTFKKINKLMFLVTVTLLVAVLAFKGTSIAPLEGDANRWLVIGGFNFQPSEVAKFTLVVMLAAIIDKAGNEITTFKKGMLPCMLATGTIVVLIFAENHVSATAIIGAIAVVLMFIGGVRIVWFLAICGVGGGILTFLVLYSDQFAYARKRISGWIDPFNPPEGVDTWQTRQSIYAIGSGGIWGVGLGQSTQKYLYVSAPQNDFVFAIACEELGLIGALIIVTLFALLVFRGVYISLHTKDTFGKLLGLGISFTVGLQAVLNICVVTNAIPNTGISLPFFSYGGTSLMMLLGEMGVLLAISRRSNLEKT